MKKLAFGLNAFAFVLNIFALLYGLDRGLYGNVIFSAITIPFNILGMYLSEGSDEKTYLKK